VSEPSETQQAAAPQKRKDPPSRPTRPELIRGDIVKESGWVYQRVHIDDVNAQTFGRMLEPLGQMFNGWEPVKGPVQIVRRADDTSDTTIARDMDTVWMRCREEEHAKLTKNENMKHAAVVKRLRTDDVDEGQISTINTWRGPDSRPVFED